MTMSVSSAMTDRKLLAKVSCGIVTHWSHDEQETVGEGFLWDCYALVLCRTGNCLRRVSYLYVTQQSHDGQETFTHKKRTPMKGVLLEWQKIILQS